MSPKKRGKRRQKENMENEVPDSSNYNSGNSSFAIISDTNLLSSNGSLCQKVQKLEQGYIAPQSYQRFDYYQDEQSPAQFCGD